MKTLVALAALALLAGCAPASSSSASGSSPGGSTCTEASSRLIVMSFIAAFNHGDTAGLDQLVYDYSRYATDPPGEFTTPAPVKRGDLLAYFAQRHQAHERLTLEALQFGGRSANDFTFEFEVTRSADGLGPTPYGGKGAVFCGNPSSALILWAMGRESFLRARLPLYASVAALLLAILAAAAVIVWRRARPKKRGAARAVRPEWIDA